jgi:hypothetical protein
MPVFLLWKKADIFMYFFSRLRSVIICIAFSTRVERVSAFFALVIHSTYSFYLISMDGTSALLHD